MLSNQVRVQLVEPGLCIRKTCYAMQPLRMHDLLLEIPSILQFPVRLSLCYSYLLDACCYEESARLECPITAYKNKDKFTNDH